MKLLSVRAAADMLGVSERTARKLILTRMEHVRVRSMVRVRKLGDDVAGLQRALNVMLSAGKRRCRTCHRMKTGQTVP